MAAVVGGDTTTLSAAPMRREIENDESLLFRKWTPTP